MSQPVYFTVAADYKAFIEDASSDADYNPQSVPVGATVTFTPLVNSGDVVRAMDADPRPVGYIPSAVTAVIDPADGRLKLRTVADSGGTGTFAPVRLLSGANLELDGPLFYRVAFTNVTYANGRRGNITGFVFEAPATDIEVNLISVGRVAGQDVANLVRATVAVGTVTTGNPGSSATVTNSGTDTAAVFDFTIPRGDAATVAVGTVSTGVAGSAATVTNSGSAGAAVFNFTIPQGVPGSATINGITSTEIGRLVCRTANGSVGVEDGANTWAKIATFSPGASQNSDISILYGITASYANVHDNAVLSISLRTTLTNPLAYLALAGKPGPASLLSEDAFKIVHGAFGTNFELWVKKSAAYGCLAFYEMSRNVSTIGSWSVTYNSNAAWQSAEPIGAVGNYRSAGVTAFGVPVATTTGTQTLTNKVITSPKINSILDTNGNKVIESVGRTNAVNYLQIANNAAGASPDIAAVGTDTNLNVIVTPKGNGALRVMGGNITPGSTDVNLNLTTLGTGVVQANGIPVVTTTGTQALTNKTLTSPTINTATISSPTITGSPNAPMLAPAQALTNNVKIIGGGVVETCVASNNPTVITHYANDIAFMDLLGGSITYTMNGSPATLWAGTTGLEILRPDSTQSRFAMTTSDVLVIEVTRGASAPTFWRHSMAMGISMSGGGYSARDVKMEVFDSIQGVWVTQYDVTGSAQTTHITPTLFTGYPTQNDITKLRWTLKNMQGTTPDIRISSIFLVGYLSGLGSSVFLPRNGGNLYGTNAAPPTITAHGNDANIDLDLRSKGTGVVEANGIPVVTTTGTQTLTSKTITSPKVNALLDTTSGSTVLLLNSDASAVNRLSIYATNAGASPQLLASGTDTNINLDLVSKGTGEVRANYVPVVTTTGTQSLTNKTISGPRITGTILDANGNNLLAMNATPSAANYLQLTNGDASSWVGFTALGTAANVPIFLYPKGAGDVVVFTSTGTTPQIRAQGADTNLNLNLQTKGTGVVTANTVPVVTTTGTQALSNKTWTSATVPATATSTGTVGSIAYDTNYVYICTATNVWRRAALATW